jgi:hypothetical protein
MITRAYIIILIDVEDIYTNIPKGPVDPIEPAAPLDPVFP